MPRMKDLFSQLRRRWLAAPLEQREEFSAAVRAYVELQEELRTDQSLRRLIGELYPELAADAARPPEPPEVQLPGVQERDPHAELLAVNQMLQVMESAWLIVRVDRGQAQLLTRGWMNVFRRWASSSSFRRHWLRLRNEYS